VPCGIRKRRVKLLASKGLVGQEMALSDSLQSIRASSVGCSAAFFCPWGKTKSDTLLFGAKEPDGFLSCFIRLLSQTLASHSGKCRTNVVCQSGKDAEEPETICDVGSSRI